MRRIDSRGIRLGTVIAVVLLVGWHPRDLPAQERNRPDPRSAEGALTLSVIRPASFEDAGLWLDVLKKLVWTLPRWLDSAPDEFGNRIEQDLDRLFSNEALSEIDASTAEYLGSQKPGATVKADAALERLYAVTHDEGVRMAGVMMYWGYLAQFRAAHRASIDSMLADLDAAKTAGARKLLVEQSAREKAFHDRLRSDVLSARKPDIQWMQGQFQQMGATFNQARGQLAAGFDTESMKRSGRSLARQRQADCPPPAMGTSGRDTPRIGAAPDAEAFYPVESRRLDIQGAVVVLADVSATGCVMRASVAATSGVPALDEAALAYAEQVGMLPAVKEGRPGAGSLQFRIQFKLTE